MNLTFRVSICFILLYSYQSVAKLNSISEISMANSSWQKFYRCSTLLNSHKDISKFYKCTGQHLSDQLSLLEIKRYSSWPMMVPNQLKKLKRCTSEQVRKFPLIESSDIKLCFSFLLNGKYKKDAVVQFNYEQSVLKIVNFVY